MEVKSEEFVNLKIHTIHMYNHHVLGANSRFKLPPPPANVDITVKY